MIFPICISTISDENDRLFMERLYTENHIIMFKMARSLTSSNQDADDVVSNACLSLIKKISLLRTLECNILQAYIVSTVKNAAFSFHRKKKMSKEVFDEDELCKIPADESDEPYFKALENSSIEKIMLAIRKLPENQQTVIRMKCFEKLSFAEISRELGENETTVRSWLFRARKKLKALLKEVGYEK